MKRATIHKVLWVVAVAGVCISGSAAASQLQAWGLDSDGQITNVPAGNSYVAIAAGDAHGLGLRSDGTIEAWGKNTDGECLVPTGIYRYVAAGADFSLAIRTDGSIAAWGKDSDGQVSQVPKGNSFVAVDGGETFAVALKSDGSIVAWGNDRWGQVSGAPTDTGFTAVVAGDGHGVALRPDGSLVTWGYFAATQGAPDSGTFTAISAGGTFCVALRSDGSLVWWGTETVDYGLAQVPPGNDYVAVSAGYLHCVALKKDGSLVGWGAGTDTSVYPHWGQANPPAGENHIAIACGFCYSLALTGDISTGTVAAGIRDDFGDDKQGSLWTVRNTDPRACWLEEANGRLELRAAAQASLSTAYYVTNNWRIDSASDFSFKIDFHYGLQTDPLAWLSVGLTPDINDLNPHHVEFGPGCGKLYPHVWYEAVEGAELADFDFVDRTADKGVLYVSYDAKLDKLYLSTSGYGAGYAWRVVSGLLHGSWAGRPLWLYIGGGSDGQEIASGEAYLDNFVMETGGPLIPALSAVYRFWSPVLQSHFYTIDPNEKDWLIKAYPNVWTYEGPVFRAAATSNSPGLAPVYRFWSLAGQGHFYTINPSEKKYLTDYWSKAWTLEGVAFYAYPEGSQSPVSKPVYRFFRPNEGSHFYTIDPSEGDWLLKTYPQIFTAEGVAFYAFE
jgi:alpha-tubulin suppressor-like RCC1 family protein